METKKSNRIKVVRVWQTRVLDGGFVLYVPVYYIVG
jgi:hypothetical protein